MTSRFLGACAACILSLCATAQALAATVSGTLQSSDQHGYIQLDFTCAAGTTCNGTYKGVEYNIKCGVTHRFNGSITLQGASLTKRIPGATAASEDVYAITGGTGAYVGATGSMKRSGNGKTDKLVFELR